MNDEEIRTIKSLQDGGTYIVRFKDGISSKDAKAWMKFCVLLYSDEILYCFLSSRIYLKLLVNQ